MEQRKLSHSQNFLINPEFVSSLIDKTDINANDLIVEIGSGKGVITMQLAKKAGRVIGIEVDNELFNSLKKKFYEFKNVEIIKADFLKWNLPKKQYKIFSNIPFNMTADIVIRLLNDDNPPQVAYLILQDKATERFIGDPISKNTQISVLLQPFFEMKIISRIDAKQFFPIPKVNIVLSMFKKRSIPLIHPQFSQLYRDFVVYGFNQWKPTVLESFGKVFSFKQKSILEKNAEIRGAKPRDLKLNQWLILFNVFLKLVPENKKYIVRDSEKRLKIQQEKLQKLHRTR